MSRQIEIPVHDNSIVTYRSLNSNHQDNQNLYISSQKFKDLLREVKIRFDTNPKFYQKEDYQKLIDLLSKIGSGGSSGGEITKDDLKTINGESIVGEGNIEIHDCELSVDYTFELANGKYIYTEGEYDAETETITPLRATYNEQTQTITLL